MSDSVQPQRRQPTRLPCPWDSPGNNTGVGCHFLLQCIKVKSESEVAQSCPTLSDPKDCSPPGSSVHGIFQARGLEWGAIALSTVYIGRHYWNYAFCDFEPMCDDYSITQNSFNALRILCALPIYPSSTPHLTPSNHWSFLFLKNSYLFGCAGS